jgi:hypothetical protein
VLQKRADEFGTLPEDVQYSLIESGDYAPFGGGWIPKGSAEVSPVPVSQEGKIRLSRQSGWGVDVGSGLPSEQQRQQIRQTAIETGRTEADVYNEMQASGAFGYRQPAPETIYSSYTPAPPPTPQWLARLAPANKVGQPITRTARQIDWNQYGVKASGGGGRMGEALSEAPIPSGQMWSRTPWSEREGYAGYLDWRGGEPLADVLNKMAMMQTNTPIGATNKRRTVARQV